MAAKNGFTLGMLLCAASIAAQAQMGGARFGYVYDAEAHSVRPIVGYPGAAYLAPAVRSEVDEARISPDGRFMVLRQGDVFVLEAVAAPGTLLLELPAFSQALWSDDAKAFALVVAGGSELRYFQVNSAGVWSSLDLPVVAGTDKLALSVDAVRKEVWFRQGGAESGLYVATYGDAEVSKLPVEGEIAALALPIKGVELLWLAGGPGGIYQLRRSAGFWQASPLQETPEAIEARGEFSGLKQLPGANFLSAHRQKEGVPARLILHGNAGEVLESLDLEGAPDGLNPILGTLFFSLQHSFAKGGALEIYDTTERRLYFVPAEAVSTTGGAL